MSSSNIQSKTSLLSTFNWQQSNLRDLLKPIPFNIIPYKNDIQQPFCHYTHKNIKYNEAPFLSQQFLISLNKLTSIKYIKIKNFSNGSEMTIQISEKQNAQFVQVYKQKYICRGKTLKKSQKLIDIGAIPCKLIKIQVNKGCQISSKNISLLGIDCEQIENTLGPEYFKLLVINPMKIVYPQF